MSIPSERVALGRIPERGHYDLPTIAAILDAAPVCHVGVVNGDQPVVLPTIHARIASDVYIHGSALARWIKTAQSTPRVCVTVSILDALVLARSAYQHTLNFRSAVILGRAQAVADPREKIAALRAIVEHVCRGRWNDVRKPNENELRATLVLRVPLTEASAKIRTGPPSDFESDLAIDVWAGVIPLRTVRGKPVPDPALRDHIPFPHYCMESMKCETFT